MENAGAVTFTETYVFRCKVTDADQGAPRRHDPARAGPHVVRRPRHHEVVERPLAQRVVRRVGLDDRRRPRPPSGPRRGRRSAPWRRPGPTARTSCRRRTRSSPTSATSTTSQVNFDGITYAKGASVLKQLVAWVGIDEFFAGVRAYFKEHAWATPSSSDLLAELEKTSGRDLTAWSKEWLRDGRRQHARARDRDRRRRRDHARSRSRQTAAGRLPDASARTASPSASTTSRATAAGRVARSVELDVDGDRTDVARAGRPRRSPTCVLLNDDDLAYAKIRLDERSLRHRDRAPRPDRATRSRARSCWGAAWDMTRDAEMPRSDYRRRSCSATSPPRPTPSASAAIPNYAAAAVNSYSHPSRRVEPAPRWESALCDARAGRRPRQRPPAAPSHGLRERPSTSAQGMRPAGLLDG